MAEHGVATARFNFHYMNAGRRSPDSEPALRAAWEEAFGGVRSMAAGLPVLLGGKSLGGRIASMCVADGMPADGLVFLGYPLHPPGKPERIRDDAVPVEVDAVPRGTRDPFARRLLAAFGARGAAEPAAVRRRPLVQRPGLEEGSP
jgi:predicted alpha/beta-hydrolase family hydrolase